MRGQFYPRYTLAKKNAAKFSLTLLMITIILVGCSSDPTEEIIANQGMRCELDNPCEIEGVLFEGMDWNGFSFANVVFDDVTLRDVDIERTLFDSVTFRDVTILASPSSGERSLTGRIINSSIEDLTLGRIKSEQPSDSDNRIEANVQFSETAAKNIVIDGLTWDDQSIFEDIIAAVSPQNLTIRNTQTKELYDATVIRYREIEEAVRKSVNETISPLSTPSYPDFWRKSYEELNFPDEDDLIPNFRNDYLQIVDCTLTDPKPSDIINCTPFTNGMLSQLSRFTQDFDSTISELYNKRVEEIIDQASLAYGEAILGKLEEDVPKAMLSLESVIDFLLDKSNEERVVLVDYLVEESGIWESLFVDSADQDLLTRITAFDTATDREAIANQLRELALVSLDKTLEHELPSYYFEEDLSGQTCDLGIRSLLEKTAPQRIELIADQLRLEIESGELRCVKWFVAGTEYGIEGFPSSVRGPMHPGLLSSKAENALANLEREYENLLDDQREEELAKQLEESRARAREEQANQPVLSPCDRKKARLEATKQRCSGGNLYACQEIATLTRDLAMSGCSG